MRKLSGLNSLGSRLLARQPLNGFLEMLFGLLEDRIFHGIVAILFCEFMVLGL